MRNDSGTEWLTAERLIESLAMLPGDSPIKVYTGMRNDNGTKWLTAERLIELLETLPGDSRVMVNSVGNLVVLTPDGTRCTAFIDFFGIGTVEPME
ncbi:MAG TPA: hypothetical protein VFP70_09525 [Burkholderiales bacterium]|nr:hypothetical protein [Burkholderiales bacterium]